MSLNKIKNLQNERKKLFNHRRYESKTERCAPNKRQTDKKGFSARYSNFHPEHKHLLPFTTGIIELLDKNEFHAKP